MWRGVIAGLAVAVVTASDVKVDSQQAFDHWLRTDAERAANFARFQAELQHEGVSNVVPDYQLWRIDQAEPRCANGGFETPPEEEWANIIATLRILRDEVVPAIGPLEVVSAYRDAAFNECVHGAQSSAHLGFEALDLVPADPSITREQLIATLCPIHAREGARRNMGLGVYDERRFHVDAHGFRGWGVDYHRTTFPCDAVAATVPGTG